MIIEKEEFNKLNQLDRIEYRQRADFIIKKANINFNGLAIILLTSYMIILGEINNLFYPLTMLVTILFLIWPIKNILRRLKDMKESFEKLDREYFRIIQKGVKEKKQK